MSLLDNTIKFVKKKLFWILVGLDFDSEPHGSFLQIIVSYRFFGQTPWLFRKKFQPLHILRYGRLEHKMDHLACFAAGMYGLAAHEEKDDKSERWMEVAKVKHV